jgi:tetratricopeptide (TPR) repeat protein
VNLGRLFRRFGVACVLVSVGVVTAAPCFAQVPATAEEPAGEAGAHPHFDRALELYRAGRYADALAELKQAAALDPGGKDLFFNLALVHEKLGQLPEAVQALERFRELETDPNERERARLTIERLKGAQEAAEKKPQEPASCPAPTETLPPEHVAASPRPILIGAASLTLASLALGTILGIKALADDPHDATTSSTLSASAVHAQATRAQREALVADVAFAVAGASAATFAGVWLLAPADPKQRAALITLQGDF